MKCILYPFLLFTTLMISTSLHSQTADAGSDQEVCVNHTFLEAVAPPTGYTGTWSVISGYCSFADLHSNSTEITGLLKGSNELKWTITNGSNTYSDNVIILNNTPSEAFTGDDEAICVNYSTLVGTTTDTGETGLWTVEYGSGTFSNADLNITDVTGIAQGLNTYKWTITKGTCTSNDEISITNNQVDAFAGTDQTICTDYSTLSATPPSIGSGTWSVVASSGSPLIGDIHSPSTTITGLGINTNNIQWTVVNANCTDYDNVVITSRKPTTSNAGTDKTICTNSTVLAANNPTYGTGTWSVHSGTGTFTNANAYNSTVNNVSAGLNQMKWTITYYTCTSEDIVDIYYDYFTANAGTDDATCNNYYNLNGNDPSPGIGEWRVTGGSGTFTNLNQYNTTVNNLIVGENTYEWKITKGLCVQTDYVVITRNSPSIASAGPDKETCNGNTIMAALNPAVGSGSWSVVSGTGTFANSNLNTTAVSNVGLNSNIYRWTVVFAACSNYDEVTVTNNYVTANAGSDQVLCGTSTTLNGSIPGSGETGTWEIFSGTSNIVNINLYNTNVNNLSFGLNKYRWTIKKGICSAYDDVEIQNNQYLASASVSGPSDICTDYASILGNIPPSGAIAYWSIASGSGTFDNSADESTVVRNLALGENTIRWTINRSGCLSDDEITIYRNSVDANAGADQDICNSNTTLTGNTLQSGETGQWTKVSGTGIFVSPNSPTTGVTNIDPGISTYRWTISKNACSDSDDITVTNNTFFVSAGTDQQICGTGTTLTATNPSPGTGFWQVISGTATIANPSNYSTSVSNLASLSVTSFRWLATKNGCNAQDEMTVYNNSVTANAGSDQIICTNYSTLNGNNPAPGTGVWTIQVGGGTISTPSNPNSSITGLSPNSNIVRWTISNLTCVSFDEVLITNNALTTNAGSDQAVCENLTQLMAQAPPSGGTGLWEVVSGGGSFQNPSQFNTNVSSLAPGFSTFKWTVFKNGCSSNSDEVQILNKSFDANAGVDQVLEQFVTETNMQAVLPVGGTGQWTLLSGGGSITALTDPSTFISNLSNGINTFRWYINYNGCTALDYVDILVLNFEAYAGLDKKICNDSLKLNARDDGGTPQLWTVVSGQGNFDDSYIHDTWVRNIGLGENIYRWSVTINGATDTDEISVISVTADAGVDQINCVNHTFLNANMPEFNSTGLWSIVAGSGTFANPTLYNTEVTNLANQNNTFAWTINGGLCIATDYVQVVYDYVYAEAGSDRILCSDHFILDANLPQTGLEGLWTIVSGFGEILNPSAFNSEVVNLDLGSSVFKWTVSSNLCSDEDIVSIFNDEVIADAGEDQYLDHNFTNLEAVLPSNASGIWTREFGYSTIENDTDPNTYVSNFSEGMNIFKWTLNNENCGDFDLVYIYYTPTSINDLGSIVNIYPNPFTEVLYFKNDEATEFVYELIDALGQTIKTGLITPYTESMVNTNTLKPGIYLIKLNSDAHRYCFKMVKE